MKCAIQLVFDDEDQVLINRLRTILAKNGVHDEAVPINHISLADIEINDNQLPVIKSILEQFSKTNKTLPLVLTFAGTFMTKENVIFLAPIITSELIRYNDELVNILLKNNIRCGKYYIKDNWQPHCTISIRVSDEELFAGFRVLKENNFLPMKVNGVAIDLLCYDPKPYNELMRFELMK